MYHGTRTLRNAIGILNDSVSGKPPLRPGHEQAGKPARKGKPAVWFGALDTAQWYAARTNPVVQTVFELRVAQATKHGRTSASGVHKVFYTHDFAGVKLVAMMVKSSAGSGSH